MIVHAVFVNFSLTYPLALFKQGIALEDNELYEPGLLRSYEVSLDLDNVRNQVQSDNPGEKLVSNDFDWIARFSPIILRLSSNFSLPSTWAWFKPDIA